MASKRLGDLLVEEGLLTQEKLQTCMQENTGSGMKLGEYLQKQSVVSEEKIVSALSRQLRIPRLTENQMLPGPTLANMIPREMAKQYQIVPLRDDALGLTCAMLDPMDLLALERIEEVVQKTIDPVICTQEQFQELCRSVYGQSYAQNFETLLDGIRGDARDGVDFGDAEEDASDSMEVSSLVDMAEDAPVIRMVNWMLATGVGEGASDIHISPERSTISLRMRVDGKLKMFPAPPKSMHLPVVSRIKILGHMDISVSRVPQDGRFSLKVDGREINIRASCTPTVNGENVVLRILDMSAEVLTLDQLGFEPLVREQLVEVMAKPHGMFLTTGPTGSGKSTTLYSLLNMLNQPDVNIITTEDPVEYRMEGIRQIELNPKAGTTFVSALRSILRQDPDIVMVGEIRDTETARVSIQAALTGHQVLSTLHTNSAVEAVTRLVDMGVEPFLVALVCNVVVAQRLIRRVCPDCARSISPSKETLAPWGFTPDEIAAGTFKAAVGCPHCKGTGYRGRAGIYEALFFDDAIREMIIERRSVLEIEAAALKSGHLTPLKYSASRKVLAGISTMEETISKIMD